MQNDSGAAIGAADHPTVQLVLRPGIIDLGWGHPDPQLLPMAAMHAAAGAALAEHGPDMLAYGHASGAGPLIVWLRRRILEREGRDPGRDGIMITGGNSLALDQVCTLLARPGDAVLVESPTYHYAVRILRDHPLELVPVPADADGLRVDLAEQAIERLRREGRAVRLIYTVPTFHNPTGANLSDDRRRALVDLAARSGALIVEDDVYRELAYDGRPPASLWSMDGAGVVVRLGSFAKTLGPGLRLGWLTAAPELVQRIAGGGVLDSGGGNNHFAALMTASFCAAGELDRQVARLQGAYAERAAALAGALQAALPDGALVRQARGGFFTWVELPDGYDTGALLALAEERGVAYIPGERFHIGGGGRSALRLAHSLYPPAELVAGAERLGAALRSARPV